MTTLTPRQLQILVLIRSGINHIDGLNLAQGKSPDNGVTHWHLCQLREAELVTWQPGQARTLQLTEAGWQAVAGYVLGPGGTVWAWEAVEREGVDYA